MVFIDEARALWQTECASGFVYLRVFHWLTARLGSWSMAQAELVVDTYDYSGRSTTMLVENGLCIFQLVEYERGLGQSHSLKRSGADVASVEGHRSELAAKM